MELLIKNAQAPRTLEVTVDILVDRDDLTLGLGWYNLEHQHGTRFRWVAREAQILAAALRPSLYELGFLVEPGPGAPTPFALEVRLGGKTYRRLEVRGKERVAVELPIDHPALLNLALSVDSPAAAQPNDGRSLSFRVFDVDFRRGGPDVLPFSMKLGKGWHPLESYEGRPFRWVENDAEISLAQESPTRFALDVEAGPSLDAKKFRLYVLGERGETVTATEIDGRAVVPVDLGSTRSRKLKLHIDGGGKRIASDPRVMNFRVFHVTAQ